MRVQRRARVRHSRSRHPLPAVRSWRTSPLEAVRPSTDRPVSRRRLAARRLFAPATCPCRGASNDPLTAAPRPHFALRRLSVAGPTQRRGRTPNYRRPSGPMRPRRPGSLDTAACVCPRRIHRPAHSRATCAHHPSAPARSSHLPPCALAAAAPALPGLFRGRYFTLRSDSGIDGYRGERRRRLYNGGLAPPGPPCARVQLRPARLSSSPHALSPPAAT